jgi:putative membrane protein
VEEGKMNKTGWAVVLIVAVLVVLMIVVPPLVGIAVGHGYYGWGMMGSRMMGGWGFPLMGGLGMLLFWLLVIGGVVWLVQSAARGATPAGPSVPLSEGPLDILKRRYARGEITKEQFDEMRHTLDA